MMEGREGGRSSGEDASSCTTLESYWRSCRRAVAALLLGEFAKRTRALWGYLDSDDWKRKLGARRQEQPRDLPQSDVCRRQAIEHVMRFRVCPL